LNDSEPSHLSSFVPRQAEGICTLIIMMEALIQAAC
jgi:hypothetical protein